MDNILNTIRLEQFQYIAIIESFATEFLPSDRLWLFGSRVNMLAKGGDIDLYIETYVQDAIDAHARQSKFISKVWDRIGEQKIDIVLNLLSLDSKELPIYDVARTKGVRLV